MEYDDKENSAELSERKVAIAQAILAKRDEAVRHRAATGIERIWREDEKLIDSFASINSSPTMLSYAAKTAPPPQAGGRSPLIIHPVRAKCEIAEGRFSDVVLPTDAKPWGMKVTPIPEMADLEKDKRTAYQKGEPVKMGDGHATVSDVAKDMKQKAKDRMAKMETVIDDQLVECDFNAELRKVIHNAVYRGTGVVKGPCVIKDIKKSWSRNKKSGVWQLNAIEALTPESHSVDPRSLFPDPECGSDIKRSAYMWECDTIKPHELASFIGVPGYDSAAIAEILEEEPKRVGTHYDKTANSYKTHDQTSIHGSTYERWEYNGGITKADLEILGCDCEGMGVVAAQTTACIIFVNDRPIKASLNKLDTNDLPYDFFPWVEITDCPFGAGIPRLAAEIVRVIINSWQRMMENAGDSSGVNIVMGAGIRPVDGKWEMTGKKAWRCDEESAIEDVKKAFAQFQVANNQPQLQAIIEMAMEQLDIETGVPTIFQGEQQKIPDTLGQSNIIVDSANITQRSRVKLFADRIIDPHITRYYNYNMQYHEDEEIKGDYRVDVSGVSILLERDTQARTLVQLFQLKADPDVDVNTNWNKVIKQLYNNQRLDVLNSDEERDKRLQEKGQQQGQGDPSIQAAQIRVQGDMEKEKMRQQGLKELAQLRSQDAERERQAKLQIEQMKHDIAVMELAQSEKRSINEIKADLAKNSAKMNLQKDLSTMGNGRAEQVVTPVSEPPQRAEAGKAFQD